MKRSIVIALCLFASLFLTSSGDSPHAYAEVAISDALDIQTPAMPEATSNMTAVGAFGGAMQTLSTVGNYAYVSEGMSFVVFDITNPASPVEVGRTMLPDIAWEIKIDGNYAYIADYGKGLQVVDISDPAAPAVVGAWLPPNTLAWGYAVGMKNGYVYLGCLNNLVVLDVSDPAAPTYVTQVAGNFWARDIAIDGNYLYVAGNSDGMTIFNISNSASPVLESNFNPSGYGYTDGVALSGNYAYLADGLYGLRVVDVSIPAGPTQVGKFPAEGGYAHSGSFDDIALDGNFAYLADGDLGLWVIDITDPNAPAYHSDVAITDGVMDVAFANNHAFTVQYQFKTFSAAAPATAPTLVGEYESLYSINVLHAQDDLLLAASRTGLLLYALDITNPAAMRKSATYEALNGCEAIQIEGARAYVGGGQDENLRVFDLATPGQISLQGTLPTPGWASRLSASGSLVFLGDGSNGVVVVDASNPAAPTQIDWYNTNLANDIAYGKGYVYVADGSGQIIVLDASNPANLTYVTGYDITTDRVHVWGDYLVTRGTQPVSFSIVDVADPTNPTLVSTKFTSLTNRIVDIVVEGNLAYILGTSSGGNLGGRSSLMVYEISNSNSPRFLAQYDMPAGAERVTVSGLYAYVGLGWRGLLSVKLLYPRIAEVEPAIGPAGWTTLINIYGDGFDDNASVEIGATAAVSTTYIAETHLQALVPSTLGAGDYDVKVMNPNLYGHTLKHAFTVVDVTAEGVFAHESDMFTTPAPPRATEPATLALHVHRVGGASALANFTVDFYEGDPSRGGTLIGTGTVASLPPNGAGTTSPVPWTPAYAMDTDIYAVLGALGVTVHREIAVLPSSTDPTPPVVNSVLINGGTGSQDTAGRTVNLQISATDVGSGLNTMWVSESMWNAGLGSWQVVQEQGWIPYASNMQWTLSGPPGSRFIDVWAADFAGNISAEAGQAHINLLYPNMWVAGGQAHIFNYDLTVGEHVDAQVVPSGDADLYVGTHDDGMLFFSNEYGNATESVIFDAPLTDWYSFIVYGYTNAMYTITMNRAAHPQGGESKIAPTFILPSEGPPTQKGLPPAPQGTPNYPVYLPLITR